MMSPSSASVSGGAWGAVLRIRAALEAEAVLIQPTMMLISGLERPLPDLSVVFCQIAPLSQKGPILCVRGNPRIKRGTKGPFQD